MSALLRMFHLVAYYSASSSLVLGAKKEITAQHLQNFHSDSGKSLESGWNK